MLAAVDADCEARDDWFLEQDVNAWSSVAYIAVGAVIVATVVRRALPRAFVALGVLATLEGVGSFLYHGGSGTVGQYLHDVPLLGLLGFVAGWHASRIRGPGASAVGALVGAAVGAVAGLIAAAFGVTTVLAGVAVVVVVGTELVARRHGLPRVWNVALILLAVVAALTWWAGTGDSALCDEQSLLQPHGAWHLISGLLLLGWFDNAMTAAWPERAPRMFRGATDRLLGLLTKALTQAFYRSVEVTGRARIPSDRPVLVVANHGNGFVDPIVVASVLGRLPRFLAKAALWKVIVARPFLALAGVLPVYRRSDGDRPDDNRAMFEACHQELAGGAMVAIFPEGTTGDRGGLDRVRTGAARIALGALPTAPATVVVPIGLAFESRIETRSAALVMVGEPIAPRALHPIDEGEPHRDDVAALTTEIASALEAVSPDFSSVEEREVMRAAARVYVDSGLQRGAATFGQIEVVARRLATTPAPARDRVTNAFRQYATKLQLIGLRDRELAPRGVSTGRLALSIVGLVFLGPLVAVATLIHLPALLLVLGATGAVRSTATKGTVRLLVGLFAGLLTWIIAGVLLADGFGAVVAGVLVAVGGAVALAVWTPLTRLVATLWGYLRARDRVGLLPPVLAARADVVAAVDAALADGDGRSRSREQGATRPSGE